MSTNATNATNVSVADRDALISALMANGERIGNYRLAEQLGWEQGQYNAVRDALVAEGVLSTGRGRGGTVYFTEAAQAAPAAPKVAKVAKAPKVAKVATARTVSAAALAIDSALAAI